LKKGCIFDLDGTLVNSLVDLAYATNNVLKKHGLPIYELSQYNFFVGNGVKKLMERALGKEHLNILDECLKDFYQYYDEHCLDHTLPYPGVKELVADLKEAGILISVVTNKPHQQAVKIVESLFPNTFTAILGQQDLYPTKPNPESSHIALMTMRLSSKDCYFIGDSNVDIDTGYNAGIETIGVSWGFRGRKELENAGADFVVDNAYEIMEIIKNDRS